MVYQTLEIAWTPRTRSEWVTFTSSRKEAARLWGDLVVRHYRIRRLLWTKWPSKGRWQKWAKHKYPNLHSQSVQQIIGEFCEAVESASQLRKNGHSEARYPWRRPRYHDVIYTNQAARIRDGVLILPNGKSGDLRVRIPKGVIILGRLMEVRAAFGRTLITIQIPNVVQPSSSVQIGIDLGVNTLISATDGERAVLVSGREAKATVQWRAKNLASIQSDQSGLTKGSRRWRRLQRRKRQMLTKADRRIRDINHKATRIVANVFPGASATIGEPFNDAAQKVGRVQAQQVSSACNRKIIELLDYKLSGAVTVPEFYTSQTCPVCGERRRCGRVYECKKCGFVAPRDVVGGVNIRSIGLHGKMTFPAEVPKRIEFVRPVRKYPGAIQVVPGESRHVAQTQV